MVDPTPVPLHLLTGFLGSGKTTLLAALLRDPGAERIAVLVNEVGELALDHWLLERVEEDVLTLASGCVCCALRDDLYGAVRRVAEHRPTRIVVETTGLADPAPIVDGLASDRVLREVARPAGVIAVVDALRAEDLLATQPEARAQLAAADRVVLTKSELAPQRLDGVRALLAEHAPGCEVREGAAARDAAWLFADGALARLVGSRDVRRWLAHGGTAHDEAFATHAFEDERPVDVDVLQLWLRLVTALDGPRLLRVKGLVEERGTGDVYALQAAGRSVSPPRRLAARPEGVRGVRLVLVERGLGEPAVERLLGSLAAAVATESRAAPIA